MSNILLPQWQLLFKDKWLLASLTWLPILLVLSVWWIFSQALAQDLPVGVIDLQKSALSRQLIRQFDATSVIKINAEFNNVVAAKEALKTSELYAYVVIPKHFDRDIYLNTPPQVSLFFNSQYILIGKLINSAVLQAHGTFNAQIGAIKNLAKGNATTQSAIANTLTVRSQITPLFNKNSNYAQFLVSAIVPAIWQIATVVSCILFLAANQRINGFENSLKEKTLMGLLKMNGFYLPFFLVQGAAFLWFFYVVLGWPMQGSFIALVIAQVFTAIACMIMANLFFFLTFNPARAMSFAAAFTAPSFAFMGVTFPVSDMNIIAQCWRTLLPISHYIEAHISQVSYGIPLTETITDFVPAMFGYLLPLILVVLFIKKHFKKEALQHDHI